MELYKNFIRVFWYLQTSLVFQLLWYFVNTGVCHERKNTNQIIRIQNHKKYQFDQRLFEIELKLEIKKKLKKIMCESVTDFITLPRESSLFLKYI